MPREQQTDYLQKSIIRLVDVLIILLICNSISAQDSTINQGTISGRILDQNTQQPLLGANIFLKEANYVTATDENGNYLIENIPVGSYTLQFSYIGYSPVIEADVIVRPNRITYVNSELKSSIIQSENVIVAGGYFPEINTQSTSITRFTSEEIRRAATIGGDINRIINGIPSLSNENQNNYIVARGGSNIENNFYIDNIRVSNLNHFPIPGTTGGGVSLLNVDFIENINIYTGGFSSLGIVVISFPNRYIYSHCCSCSVFTIYLALSEET
jgi:hypothetical protein